MMGQKQQLARQASCFLLLLLVSKYLYIYNTHMLCPSVFGLLPFYYFQWIFFNIPRRFNDAKTNLLAAQEMRLPAVSCLEEQNKFEEEPFRCVQSTIIIGFGQVKPLGDLRFLVDFANHVFRWF